MTKARQIADFDLTLPSYATKTGVETLTNKTLTSPTITTPTINTPIITVPSIAGVKLIKTAPTIASGIVTLDLSSSNCFAVNLNANITSFTVTNVPTTGNYIEFILELTADGTARTVTWTLNSIAGKFAGGTAPTLTSTNGKKDTFVIYTHDAGASWMIFKAGQNL